MKFLKKAVSALLASVMCIPSGILSFASAEEENQVTTVTLSDTENGLMQFSEDCMAASTASQDGYHMMQVNEDGELEQIENDGSVWAFNYGDLVEVELLPDEGFHVKSFTVSDSESGDVLAETETQDNVFSFTMPQSSVIVDVIFDDGSGSNSNEPDSDNDESENHKEPDNASGNGETEPEGGQEQDEGTQNQNQPSEEADVPVSAAADKVSSLQKEIDSLPDAIDYATGEVAGMGEEKVKELEEKVKRLKRAYFEEITDEQADQINPAKLYGSLIMMEYMNSEGNTRYTPDAQKTEELQERINSLDHVFGIAFPIDVESSYIFMAYNDGNTEAQVSNEEMRQKFLDTLNLVHEMQMVDEAYADENIDSEFLIQMRAFFTTGVGIMLDEVMPLTAGGDPKDWWKDSAESGGVTLTGTYSQDYSKDTYSPVSGSYKSLGHNEYGGNNWNTEVTMKNNSTGKNEKFNAVAYCGNADWHVDAARENGRVYFDAGRIAKLIESRGAAIITPKGQLKSPADFATYLGNDKYKNDKYTKKDEENRWAESGRGILMRLILWYGKEGPGYGQDGMPQPSYAATHTALSYLYSQQLGTKWGGMGIDDENWTNFYKACVKKYADAAPSGIKDFKDSADGKISDGKLANGADVTFESFCVYVICPSNKDQEWQHIFFFCADGGDESNPDPICLALVKKPAKEFRENEALAADAKLAGAKYKVDFYPNLTAKSAKNIPKDLSPKCSWTFTTSKSETRGSKFYKRFMTKVNDGLTGNTIPIAGIDFGPESGDMTQDRDKWKNEFIDANDLKTWRENFGKDGAYHIYEVEPPKGFGLGGKIEDKGGTGTSVEDGSRGIVIRIKGDLTKNSIEDGKAAIFVEGKEIKKSGYIELEGEKDSKTFSAALLHAETNNTWEVKSTAAVVSTGGHKAEPDSGEIEVKDTIVITPKEQDDSTYIASVKLYDKTDDKYIDVTWTPAANQEVDGKAIVHKQKLGSGEKKIKFTVNGKISTDGMADHELVFIAEVKAKNGSETSESVKTSKDDTAEMITFGKEPSEPGTSIAHNEIQRKAGTGEAIAKAEAGQSLTDKITYSGLESGKSYQIKAWLVDAASSTKIEGTDVSENKTASGSNGSWDITFNFDGTELGGKTLVAFVEIYDGSNLVLDMKNAGDKNETVLIPGASTELIDQDTKDHTTAEGKSLLIDTITYNNLLPNTTYKIISKIVDKESGETVYETEGEDYRTEDSTSGSFEIKLEFEVETEEPASYVAFEEIQIEAGEEGSGNWVTLIKHEDPEDEAQQTVVPKIKTFARDQKTDYNISFAERYVNIYDVVHYENLEQGQEYTLVSTLMDKDTGEVVYDDSGKEQVIETTFKAEEHLDTGKYGSYGDIIPNNHDGDGITFSLNAESFAGRTLVVFEELFKAGDDGMSPIASETDLENADQTIHFPKIWTNAITDETQTSIALSGDGTSIIKDTVSYENLIPGLTYRIKGRVIDKHKTEEAGAEVVATGTDGKPAVNSVDFTPDSADGTKELTFDIDTSKYADDMKIYKGAVFVVFEELYVIQKYEGDDAESIVAAHTDITDDTQTIYIPYITTTLLDTKTGLHIMYAESGACLVDTISYYSFKPGMQFFVSGRLIDMETGKVLRDSAGNEAKIEYQSVTAEGSGDGTWELAYNIDASSIEGATVVAYAEVYIQGGKGEGGYTQVAVHNDFFDREERVYIPHIDTKAYDQDTVNHIAHADGSVYVVDEVTYDNIIPNVNYTLESELRWRNADGSDGGRVTDASGKEQFITTRFFADHDMTDDQYLTYGKITPDNSGGGIIFHFNAEDFDGKTVVVYERLYIEKDDGTKHLVADHQDITDEDQSIHFPKVWTDALDSETFTKTALADRMVTIVDTFKYENVLPGHTYELQGFLVDKNNTKRVDADKVVYVKDTTGGAVSNSKRFYSEGSAGTVELQFSFDATAYDADDWKGMVLVVYEYLYIVRDYLGDDSLALVGSHDDIDDPKQTIYIPYMTTTLLDTKTGLHIMYAEEDACLIDTVSYYKCLPGGTYYVSGRLIDMWTGNVLLDSNGNEVRIDYQQVTASSTGDGTWDLVYDFDASTLAGTTVVAYAEIYVKNPKDPSGYSPVAIHDEFFDPDERVYIPFISTTLLDQKTNSHYALAEKDVLLYDTVHYTDVMPGDYEYKFETELRDQATGEVVVDDAGRKLFLTTNFLAHFDMRDDQFATYGDVIPQNYEGSGITFEIDGEYFEDRTLVCYERLYIKGADGQWHIVADHQVLLDAEQTVHIGKGYTEALDSVTKTQTGMISKNTTIVDTFYYKNLNPDYTYELRGKVVEKNTTIATGTDVVVAENTVSNLNPDTSSGAWHNSFTFDTTKYNDPEYYGTVLVVYEYLYQIKRYDGEDDELLIAYEEDINNASQTVWYPHIETELLDSTNGTHILSADEKAKLVDTVSYHNMQPNATYTLSGRLIDMESGKVITDAKGRRLEKTMEVMSSDNGDGTWDITYNFDASTLAGTLVVAYAEVYVKNGEDSTILSPVAIHNEFWDLDERVYIPIISTVATDQKTNSHISFAEDNMWVTDRVYYSYLQPDSQYRLISTLVDKDTGETVVDDKGILQRNETTFNTMANSSQEKYLQTISNPFTDSSDTGTGYAYGYVVPGDGTTLPDGSKPDGIVFTFDGGTFEGRTLVIYEELQIYKADGTWATVARHMDLDDENQTIHIPKVRTNAIDSETMTHLSKKDGSVTIIDTVTYENLIPGLTYSIEGCLMDKLRDDEKGSQPIKDADGHMITGTVTFTPKNPSGTEKVYFKGNVKDFQTDEGEFSSETLVVFEDLYLLNSKDSSNDKLKIAEHRDINDENQTIYFPRSKTKVMTYDLNGNPKQGDANHINGYAVYDCTYCKKSFLTEREAQNHINNTVLCKNKGASVKAVTEYTVYDTLYYENLIPGRTYQVVGTLIDTATGEAVLKGHTIVQSDTKYFTPGDKNGEVDVVFHIDGVDLAGGRYVVYEEVFLNGSSVTSHMDINDKEQMFNIIDMKTSAKDSTTGTNISTGNTISTIIDTVEMGPLVENEKYYLNAVLMDATKDSMGVKSESYGSYYKDATGEMVQGLAWREKGTDVWHEMSEPVTGPSYSRTGGRISIEVKFSVDTITEHGGKNYQGETYVLFEELRLENGEVVAQHKDLTDEQQTIQIGGMYTVAYDKDTGSNIMEAAEGKTLYDTVYYSNLKPSSTYKVTTRIYVKEDSNMETGEYVEVTALNAANLVAASHVTSRSGTGSWTISASMPDLSKYAGKTLVVYEDIVDADGTQVVVENNLYNESQSIHLPKATTYEADDENGLHFTRSEAKWLCSNDSCVTYTCNGCGLEFHSEDEAEKHLPDCWNRDSHSYTCTSGIFDTKAEAEKHTAPVYECDNCKIHFADEEDAQAHISGECKKAAVLRANQLVRDENGNAVNELWYACSGCGAQFKTNQMCLEHINGSDICYTYTDINAEHNAFHNVNAKITDTVNYTNLIPGRLYRIDGWVYNAETGQKAVDAEGEEITASATFIPMSSRGSAELKFSFNASGMEGYKYAVYAEVYYTPSKTGATPVVVARHNENLKSADEAFYIPAVSTSAVDSYTETNVTLADTVTTVKDTVTFSGLKANEKYVLKGTVMDAATMDALVLPGTADKVTASKQFTAKATSATDIGITVADGIASGWASIDFTFSTSGLEGKTLVVFEELYLVQPKGDVIIGQHTEIMDEKQTTHIPMMRTYAYDVETNEQTAGADESVTLVDKVVLTNLVKGKRYKLAATLMDPVTGKVMQDADGHDITGTLDVLENSGNNIFTASTSGRTVKNMKFVFDGSNLAGKTAVVWETLYMEGERGSYSVIAQHNPLPDANYEGADMDYLNQSIAFPKIGTTAKDADTNTIFTKAGRSTIIDTVSYENLTAGLEYKMVGTIYDIKSGTVLADTLNDSYTVTKYFTPDASGNGTVDLEFSFSTKDMAGRTFVVFEELYLNDVLIAEHKDPDDLKQTIMVPKIGTKAVSEDLGLQMTFADDDAVIIDTVSYENLIPDREYTVKGKLMDKKTGKPLLDYYGDEITGETTFTPELSHGTVDVQFRFNAAKMEGVIAVAYEELFYLDASIADHKDIHDEEQTVYFPKAWSVAKGNETDYTHVGPADSIMTITDTVYYENLLGDREYHIRGVVMDAETGEPAVDANGDEVVEEKTFTTAHPDADSASKAVSGSVDVVFTFDATGMRGKTLVIYEYIYYHKTTTSYLDYQIAEHTVQTDELQMIHIPEIGTTAWDSETKHHITKADDDATMIDTVAYKNLVPGLEYTLDAYLIDLDENGEIAKDDYGQDITGTTTFVPKDWNGTVDVRFNDREITGLAGHTLVAFEFLYYKDTLIEHHDNPEDEAQTIHIPKIATHARSFESDSHNSNTEAYINVVDEIEYWNLVPGLEYTAIGVIVNKKTGQPAIDAEGNYIKGSTTFTPDESDGTVDVVFTFDSTGMEDTDLVVFEEIFYKGELPERASVAEHSDLLDEEQSVSIPKISNTMLMDTKTGLKMALAEDSIELTDTVSYKGLYPGTQYEIVGKLYNAETKEPVRDKNNEEVVGVLWFTPEEKQGQEEITFEFSGLKLEGITLAAYTELYVVKDGDELSLVAKHNEKLTDKDEMVSIPKARTTAADKDTSINYSEADKTITLVDTITYEGLIPGYAYTATGVLVDKQTQNPVTDNNGNEITAETSFVAHEADGTVNVTFTFDAEGFAGKTYNVFETITCNGKVVAEHKDPNDEDQDMHFTKVSTNAFGTETGVKMVLAEDASSVTDTVYYENLKPGEEYTVTGKLFNAETGEPVLDPSVNVNPYEVLDITEYWVCDKCGELFFQKEDATAHITGSETCDNFTLVLSYDEDEYKKLLESAQLKAEKTFTAESSDGSIDLVYELNTKPLAGKSVVATAVITYKGVQIGSHEDLNDKDETVNVPEIGTMAVDKENGMHVSNPDETITIVDTVEYKNLTVGMEYTMSGYLVDKATGEAALDDEGNQISSETVFTAEQADGTVEVVFTFDGKNLAGHSLVAFESLSVNTELKPVVAEHKDPEDEEQTVDIPEIKTTASDASTNSNIIKAGENTTVIDRVYYHNLDSGKTYTIRGVLIDKATGKPIVDESGNEITASKEFTVKQPDGYTDIEFTFNAADHMGKTLVAFEELILKGHVIETHKDPDDEDQTVYVPKVGTTATDKKTGTHTALAEGKITIVDKVAYSNIAPGEDYKLIGTLVDAETGKTLEGPVETSFKAEAESGTAEVEFVVDSEILKGKKAVVFEELQARAVTSVKESEIYVCSQCGKEFTSKTYVLWHFEDSEECSEYTVTFKTVKEYGDFITIAEHKDLTDKGQTVYVPEIRTTAKDAETNTKLSYADDKTVIIDTVHYESLEPGTEYEMTGTLMDKEAGKPVEENGKPVTSSVKFTPEAESGDIDITFTFDSTEYVGKALVAYENLTADGKPVAKHENPDDEDQTVYIPEIGTTALDKTTEDHIGPVGKTIIVDTVAYHNLIPGLSYTVKGTLMDKATGKPYEIGTDDGKDKASCTAETVFTAKEPDGTVDLVFEVETSKNLTLVAFEELFYEGKLIADHKDIDDEGQSVNYPEIRTHAANKETGGHTIPASGMATIVDTVTYENLIPGKEYTINGELMDKETGKGTGYTSSITFTPDKPSGSVQLEFKVNARDLAGSAVVAFETLYYKGKELTSHADITDKDQTIDIPEIRTHAKDEQTQMHVVSLGEKVKIIDTVTYKGLTPGTEYTMRGTLMLKGEGSAESTGITSEKKFVPDEPDGSVELEFIVDSTKYAGMSLVAYEKLFDKNTEIADHENPDDEDQTVHVPEIGTKASINDAASSADATEIVDVVRYKNLVPGMSYTLSGKLMDKATGKELGITASKAFTPETPDGEVSILFKINPEMLKDHSVVVFETLMLNDIIVAKHEDINDRDQTVSNRKIATHAVDKETETKIVTLGEKVIVLDTVTYEGLVPGTEYTMTGTLMLKKENGPVESTGITASKKFVPVSPDGEVTLEFTVDSTKYAGMSLVAYEKLFDKDVEIANHENPDDEDQTVYVPEIRTTASIGGKKESTASKNTIITDTVSYHNLVPGIEYTMTGVLMDKETGKPTGFASSAVFTPSEADGKIDMEFHIDTSGFAGKHLVVFEKLKVKDVTVAEHEDINDKDQTVDITPEKPGTPEPSIRTLAQISGKKSAVVSTLTSVTDTVSYTNLVKGRKYTMKGVLMVKDTNSALVVNGKEVSAEKEFTAESESGSVELEFVFDSSALAGTSLVAFETLYADGSITAEHKDINDEDQTVHLVEKPGPDSPSIRTTATIDGEKKAQASAETVITDTVTYKNLRIGMKYTMKGVLMDKSTEKPLLVNGKKVTSEAVFTPQAKDGSISMTFTFDSSSMIGSSIVVFEELYANNDLVASHEDIGDKDQTVNIVKIPEQPFIMTYAEINGEKSSAAGKSATITDKVTYHNLTPGTEYTLKGVLMNKASGKEIFVNGKKVTAETKFKPAKADGTVDMKFVFDSSALGGTSVVVFEDLYIGSTLAASHHDINDEDQTVEITKPSSTPEIRTYADINGRKSAAASTRTTITDKVSYKGLVPGKRYTLTGFLMNKASGKKLSYGGKVITSTVSFIPQKPEGSVEMKFSFDSSNCAGMSIVVFEYLYADGSPVASHENLNDEDQTVFITKPSPVTPVPDTPVPVNPSVPNPDTPKTPVKVKTGDSYFAVAALFAAAVVILSAAIIILRKKED